MPTHFHVAPVGTNPMDQPDLYKRARASKIKLVLAVLGSLLIAILVCGLPVYFLARPNIQAAADNRTPTIGASLIATGTNTLTSIATRTPTNTTTPAQTLESPTLQPASPTAFMVTRVVTQLVVGPVQIRTVVQTRVVEIVRDVPVTVTPGTMTPQYSQTPWVITVVVIATNTSTPTPTRSQTPTQTPKITRTPTPTTVSVETIDPNPPPVKTITDPTTVTPTPTSTPIQTTP